MTKLVDYTIAFVIHVLLFILMVWLIMGEVESWVFFGSWVYGNVMTQLIARNPA